MNIGEDLSFSLGDLRREQGFSGADEMVMFHCGRGFLDSLSIKERLHGDLGRPDAYELAPGKRPSFPLRKHVVEKVLEQGLELLALAVSGKIPRYSGCALVRTIAEGQGDIFFRKNHPQKRLSRDLLILAAAGGIRFCQDLDVLSRVKSL